MRIGEVIKEERTKRGLTQEELGQHLHVSRQTISSWEMQRTFPDLERVVLISDFFEISLDQLLREDTEMVKTITKEVKSNRRRGKIIIGMTILLVLGLIASIFMLQDVKSHNTRIVPIDAIEVRVDLNGEEINPATTLKGTARLANRQTFAGSSLYFEEDTIYVVFYQAPHWRETAEDFELTLDTLPENQHFTKIIAASMLEERLEPNNLKVSEYPFQRVIYEEQ